MFRRLRPHRPLFGAVASLFVLLWALTLGGCNEARSTSAIPCLTNLDCPDNDPCVDGFCPRTPRPPSDDGGRGDATPPDTLDPPDVPAPRDVPSPSDVPTPSDVPSPPDVPAPSDVLPPTDVPRPDVLPPPDEACIAFDPELLDFGLVRAWSEEVAFVALVNCGRVDVFLSRGIDVDAGPFEIVSGPDDGLILRAGERVGVAVSLVPSPPGLVEGALRATVRFDRPDGPPGVARATLFARVEGGPPPTEDPLLRFEPPSLDFGPVRISERAIRDVSLCNDGGSPLDIASLLLQQPSSDPPAFQIVSRPAPDELRVPPGRCLDVTLSFTPVSLLGDLSQPFTGALAVRSNAANGPFQTLRLSGTGLPSDDTTPGFCLRPLPTPVDFGTLPVGGSTEREVRFIHCGTTQFSIDQLVLEDDISTFSFASAPRLPRVLRPGDVLEVLLLARPARSGSFQGTLVALWGTNERTAVPLRVRTPDVGETCPTPFAGASRVFIGPYSRSLTTPPRTEFYLDPGFSASVGAQVAWRVITAPPGTAPLTFAATPANGRVSTTLPSDGLWLIEMEWRTPDRSCSGTATVEVLGRSSSIGQGLRFVLTWRTPGDPDEFTDPGSDLDLHLVRRTRNGLQWNSPNDCYFGNREPVWGLPSDPTDNPRLLRDEVNGMGPEILVIENPTEEYHVGIHYFGDNGFGRSIATLRIFRDGIEIYSVTRELQRTGQVWIPAAIELGGTRIRPIEGPLYRTFPEPSVVP